MPSFSASRQAWSGAPPPNAIKVRSSTFFPLSIAWTRAALAMFSQTVSVTPNAASAGGTFIGIPMVFSMADAAARPSSFNLPPAKLSGSMAPSSKFASVIVGSVAP